MTVDVKAMIEGQGATFSDKVHDQVTHLVTTEKDVAKRSTKYEQARKFPNCQIVSLEWLQLSTKSRSLVPEKEYILKAGPATETSAKVKQEDEPGTKRSFTQDNAEDQSNKRQKDSQKASSKSLTIPVDGVFLMQCRNYKNPEVYIDDENVIYDATLNQTVASKNNNKFYRLQLIYSKSINKYITWTRWGRVGEQGQFASIEDPQGSLDSAKKAFLGKFKDKSGLKWEDRLSTPKHGKYTFIERNYEDDDEEEEKEMVKKEKSDFPVPESKLSKPVQDLMSFIFNMDHFQMAMAAMSYDSKKLPLGKLSDRALKTGFATLKELSELHANPSLASDRYNTSIGTAQEDLSNRYFTTIPHVFGRNRPPILSTLAQIKKEVELLEALTDMDVANEIMKDAKEANDVHELDRQFENLGLHEMTPLEKDSAEFQGIEEYLLGSSGATHNLKYKVIDIFRIERQGENDRFQASSFAKLQNKDRRLLWHGSRSSNFGGILSQGLRIAPPEAPVNGYMFGKGVYLADTSTKSANYCCPYNSGGMGLLLLCEAELGDPMLELIHADSSAGENARKQGKFSTLGKGRNIPGGWKDAGCINPKLTGVKIPDVSVPRGDGQNVGLQYNEYIAYDVAQIQQRYLLYVHMC
ncbi:hypothetical protein N7468_005828 [Penicillium chermesinum]|uniref:Poly [ADP-ribose] polymerase n=1 Tax=Penicillium chermesinum TaxID=63820 RepID=A0A9W9P2D3_9EURO|nr:uncharacterized protein N7468_005828 [Penicillium chermesinum]KAJ5232872.1 hypothetical protein N7468_005828 [Penicillium chermesinum]KAJ6172524.1 hypothetical protein N7470_001591 [Penicillium chermesinum]